MPAPQVNPKYVYKIVETEPPSPLPAVFPPVGIDKQDGFIHLSTARQIPQTADRFFSSHQSLYLLKVHLADGPLASHTKWETPPNTTEDDTGNYFPHLYGSFGTADVESVRKFERAPVEGEEIEGEFWKDVFGRGQNAKWLE